MARNARATQLSISLPQELAQAVYQQIRDGTYSSAGEVVRAALRQLLQIDDPDSAPPPAAASQRQPRTGSRQRSH